MKLYCEEQAVDVNKKVVCLLRTGTDRKDIQCPWKDKTSRERTGFPCYGYKPLKREVNV